MIVAHSQDTISSVSDRLAKSSLDEKPREGGSLDPRKHGVGLCEQCSRCLIVDDLQTYQALLADEELKWVWSCNSGFDWTATQYNGNVTLPDLPELSNNTAQACVLCQTIKALLLEKFARERSWLRIKKPIPFGIRYKWVGSGREGEEGVHLRLDSLAIKLLVHEKEWPLNDIEFPITADTGTCQDWLEIKRRPIEGDYLASERHINMIQSWIEDSGKRGIQGQSFNNPGFIPARILDLEPETNRRGVDSTIVLLETANCHFQEVLRYACLSYCWGNLGQQLRTTPETLAEHKRGICIENLPQTLQDAVVLCRKLGIRYLWIDALCIIQEDKADWEKESVRMADIFGQAFLTIGAAAASSCYDGFLQRTLNPTIHVGFNSRVNPSVSGTFSIRLLHNTLLGTFHDELEASQWNHRGWVWQEQILSKRMLIFGKHMIHMKCDEHVFSEDGTEIYIGSGAQENGNWYSRDLQIRLQDPHVWMQLVTFYTRRKLTYARDKLGAISGMVRHIQRLQGEKGERAMYIAGHWLDKTLEQSLRWHLDEGKPSYHEMIRRFEGEEYTAPSWSWASREQQIGHIHAKGMTMFSVISYSILPAGTDPLVGVKRGCSITLWGKVAKLPLNPFAIERPSETALTGSIQFNDTDHFWYMLDWNPTLEGQGDDSPICRVILFLTTEGDGDASGILLLPIDGSEDIRFYRVGMFRVFWTSKSDNRFNYLGRERKEQHRCKALRWRTRAVEIL